MQGVAKILIPGEAKRASKVSNSLTIRTPESIITDVLSQNQTFPGKVGKALHKIGKPAKKLGTAPLGLMDSLVAYSTWLGAEAKGMRIFKKTKEYKALEPSQQKAAQRKAGRDYADDVVVRAQGSAAKSARAPIQGTAEGKFITNLQTFTIANFDYLTRHVMGIKNAKVSDIKTLAKAMEWVAVTSLVSDGFIQIGWDSPNPTPIRAYLESMERTDDKVKAIKEAAKELLEYIPIVGGRFKHRSELTGSIMEQLVRLAGGDITALPRLLGIPGTSTVIKGYRAANRDGTAADVLMGRYVKKPKRDSSGGLSGL